MLLSSFTLYIDPSVCVCGDHEASKVSHFEKYRSTWGRVRHSRSRSVGFFPSYQRSELGFDPVKVICFIRVIPRVSVDGSSVTRDDLFHNPFILGGGECRNKFRGEGFEKNSKVFINIILLILSYSLFLVFIVYTYIYFNE